MQLVTYQKGRHSFFDELATLLIGLSSFNAAIESFWNSGVTRIPTTPDHTLYLYGRFYAFAWHPNAFMHDVKHDRWPNQLALYKIPANAPEAKPIDGGVPFTYSAAWKMVHGLVGSMFIRYYEASKSVIESRFGCDTSRWPDYWKFARVVRNALAHDGFIEIRNPLSAAVSWNGVVVFASDSGKLLFDRTHFLDVGDLLALLADLDGYVADPVVQTSR